MLTMRTVADVLFGIAGQVLYFDATEGRPSSVTSAQVFPWDFSDDDTPEDAITGGPTVEASPNTTTDDVAGAGEANPSRVPLTSTAGCADDRLYLLIDPDGAREVVEVLEVEAGVAVVARHELHRSFASGSTFQSTRITATVDTAWASDVDNLSEVSPNPGFRVRWIYVVAGVTCVADTYFNLVRYGARHGVTAASMEGTFPGCWMTRLPTDQRKDSGRSLLDESYRAVKLDLHALNKDDTAIAEAEVVDELVRYKALELLEFAIFLAGAGGDDSRYIAAQKRYTARFDGLIRIADNTPERDETGAAGVARPMPLSVR